jgi:hypothetical protein
MGSVEPFTVIKGPEAWTAEQYKHRSDWINFLCASLLLPACRMGSVEPFAVIEGPEAWTAEQYKHNT